MPLLYPIDFVKNNKKMVKISVLIIFQGKWFEKCET